MNYVTKKNMNEDYDNHRAGSSGKAFACMIAILACLAVICFSTGCRNSDALKEIVYDQTSENIDQNTSDTYLINDPSSSKKSNDVSSSDNVDSGKAAEKTQNIVVYSSDPNASQYKAKKSVWSSNPEFKGIEASEGVKFYIEEKKENDQETPDEQKTDETNESDDLPTVPSNSTASNDGDKGSNGSGESKKKGKKSSPNAKKTDTKTTDQGGGNEKKKEDEPSEKPKVIDDTDDFSETKTADRLAAFGQYAVIVQMIGGEGALVAADKELLSSKFTKVFADEGADSIAQGWSDDGSASKIDVDAIIDAKADAILVTSSDYANDVSASDRKKLNKAGIEFRVVSTLTNSTFIKKTVTTVGKILAESKEIGNAGKTTDIASDYKNFHDELVKSTVSANGEKLASAGSTVYEKSNKTRYSYNTDAKYTLLINAWDSSVKYNKDEWGLRMNGVALSYVGYANTPVSYYIQAGGLINNAAARGDSTDPGLTLVWQFATPALYKRNFTYSSNGIFAESVTPTRKRGGTSWDPVLLTTNRNQSSSSGGAGSSFGSSEFPKIIAATQEIKSKMIQNSKQDMGAYHPYLPQTNNALGSYGIVLTNGNVMLASIGSQGTVAAANAFEGDGYEIPDSSIVVNPCGLFTSWTEDGGVETVLESAWVNDEVNDESSSVGWENKMEEFYKTFYRYELTSGDVSTITAGQAD